jgi:hypothetical protein
VIQLAKSKKDKQEEGDPNQPYPDQQAEQSQEGQPTDPGASVESQQSDDSGETQETSKDELTPYQPRHRPLENAGVDHHAVEAQVESERQGQREEHNRRTGDASR